MHFQMLVRTYGSNGDIIESLVFVLRIENFTRYQNDWCAFDGKN